MADENLKLEVYRDVVQPATRKLGVALGEAVNIALFPIWIASWGYDRIKEYAERVVEVQLAVGNKLERVPAEQIAPPPLAIAGPILEALKYAGEDADLRELYAQLLATSMDRKAAHDAHPAFVDIIRQITSDEAKILRLFSTESSFAVIDVDTTDVDGSLGHTLESFSLIADRSGCSFPDAVPQYTNNLCRLGLCSVTVLSTLSDRKEYEETEAHPLVKAKISQVESLGLKAYVSWGLLSVSTFGRQFCRACVDPNKLMLVKPIERILTTSQ